MTNHWNDIANADCVLIMGANPANNHPASFGHVLRAKEKGASLVVVDPRYTRSASHADVYAPMRSGTDIAFLGGVIRYVIEDIERNPANYNLTYLREYTNATYLLVPNFKGPGDLDGLFSGYNSQTKAYDKSSWQYQVDDKGIIKKDPSLTNPNCVFQVIKRHFSRYDPTMVNRTCGTPTDVFAKVCETFAATGKTGKAGTIMYAMGYTQHTYGTQNIRAAGILQLLLGNIGVAGGGINALRGEGNVQGSTDFGVLFHILPGYLGAPVSSDVNLQAYVKRLVPATKEPQSANWWQNYPKYIVSLLKAWYGDAATAQNDFGFHYLPKYPVGGNYSWLPLFRDMNAGKVEGLMVWGQNPAVCSPDVGTAREAMGKLKWMVAVDLFETETAAFWHRPGVDPKTIDTEVFLLPAACSYEKEGSISNSGRWSQWRYKAVEPPGEAKSDAWIINGVMTHLRALYKAEGGPAAECITKLVWDYGEEPDPEMVSREINGKALVELRDADGKVVAAAGQQLASFATLTADGKTSSGCWIYCGHNTDKGNLSKRRDKSDPSGVGLYPGWAWSWPLNRRVIYNRASVDLSGQPWDKEHPLITWDGTKWVGDVPDGAYPPLAPDPTKGKLPFIMKADGVGSLFGGASLVDGPLPEHYEPWESPVKNPFSGTQNNPLLKSWGEHTPGDASKYPIVAITFRLTEHWQSGAVTRSMPWLVELFPEMFIEVGEELAAQKGIKTNDWVVVSSARGQVKARANVTARVPSFKVDGKVVHQIAIPWHWGYTGISTGDSANVLTPPVGDANTAIPEYRAFLCNVERA